MLRTPALPLLLLSSCLKELPLPADTGSAPCVWYVDGDNDGFGDPEQQRQSACDAQPPGTVENDLDCDDGDAQTYPDAPVLCEDADRNCDGVSDLVDSDGDGFPACEECDDADPSVFPDADELCNDRDDDCDSVVDEEPTDPTTWYIDSDADGYGQPDETTDSCGQPPGYTDNSDDCDDTNSLVFPGADEHCDELDEDCDELVDEDAVDPSSWYVDFDGDGYGDPATGDQACASFDGRVAEGDDCDDVDADVHPDAPEVCDGMDNDCDGLIDDADDNIDANSQSLWYDDLDTDGYGDPNSFTAACLAPSGAVADDTDCDDTQADVNPGAVELAHDGMDNDCDGTDDNALAASTGWSVVGTSTDHALGRAWVMSDLDGAGNNELVLGVPTDSSEANDAGAVVFLDSRVTHNPGDYDSDRWLHLYTVHAEGRFGTAVLLLGDIDGDNTDQEIAISAPGYDGERGIVWIASVESLTGRVDIEAHDEGEVYGKDGGGTIGEALAAGDLDDDGQTDLVIGGPLEKGHDEGRARVFLHSDGYYNNSGDADSDTRKLDGAAHQDQLGTNVHVTEDMNGDGYDELVACAPYSDVGASSSGTCWIINGDAMLGSSPGNNIGDYSTTTVYGDNVDDHLGGLGPGSLASGDVDNDGATDLIIGIPDAAVTGANDGRAVVLLGGTAQGSYSANTLPIRFSGDGGLGTSILAEDFDSDNDADLVFGAPRAQSSTGQVYRVESSFSGCSSSSQCDVALPGGESGSWLGEGSGDRLGAHLAGFIDLDGDGNSDLVLGAPGHDTGNLSDSGKAYVFQGF